jgi:hypothetical protein
MCSRGQIVLTVFVLVMTVNAPVVAAEQRPMAEDNEQGFLAEFKDPDDGMLDMSQWLLENIIGFLPVPIIITEPAVDNGLGLAGVLFHQPKSDQMNPEDSRGLILPNVSALALAYTGNDSWIVGGGHFRNWSRDSYRYNIMGGYADINLDWYGSGRIPADRNGIRFNAKGAMLDQHFLMRVRESDWFLGAAWRYLKSDVTFELNLPIELPTIEDSVSGISAIARFENLDFRITPRDGFSAELKAGMNREAIGSDFNFQEYTWKLRQYFEFAEKFTLAWRLDGAATSGDVPFYLEPFVVMQGIPAMRYQGATTATFEVRGGYDLHPRWTVLGFAGGGRAAESISELGSASTHTAYGGGFRYLLAKALGMRVGLDIAHGPEGTYIYLVTGSAWK